MRTHNIPSCYKKIKEIVIIPPDLALLSTLLGSNNTCLKLVFMVPMVFEPLKFDCTLIFFVEKMKAFALQKFLTFFDKK